MALLCCLATSPAAAQAPAEGGQEAAMQALGLAKYYYKSGRFKEAAKLFLEAYAIDPKIEFLFNAARAEQRAVLLKQAKAHFLTCIASKNAPKKVVERAHISIKEIENIEAALASARGEGGQLANALTTPATSASKDELVGVTDIKERTGLSDATGPAKAASTRVAPSGGVQASVAPQATWKTTAGWGALGSGAVLGLVGLWLYADGDDIDQLIDDKTFHNNNEPLGKDGKVQHISYEEYDQEKRRAEVRVNSGITAMAVGAAAIGLGGWWLLTAPTQVSLAATPGGGRVAVNWRF
jgi:tetratricopeptide (TPR) repeat protein